MTTEGETIGSKTIYWAKCVEEPMYHVGKFIPGQFYRVKGFGPEDAASPEEGWKNSCQFKGATIDSNTGASYVCTATDGKWEIWSETEWLDKIESLSPELDRLNQDLVNHPPHYTSHPSGIECIQITEHMGFNLGNALKYIWRCDLKLDAVEDLEKAKWYIDREIDKRKKVNE